MNRSSYSRYKSFASESEAIEFVAKMKQERIIHIQRRFPIETELNSIEIHELPKKDFGPCAFRVDADERVHFFVDGSYFYDDLGNAKALVRVIFDKDHPLFVSSYQI